MKKLHAEEGREVTAYLRLAHGAGDSPVHDQRSRLRPSQPSMRENYPAYWEGRASRGTLVEAVGISEVLSTGLTMG